jgi:hypothetical protein
VTSATLPFRPLARRATASVAQPLLVPGPFRRAAIVVRDLLGVTAIVLCIPFVVLAVATPVVLCVGLLMWLTGLR